MKDEAATFRIRAAEVREIAKGIFDQKDRRSVLRLVAEYEKVSELKVPRTRP
jgi:hypothetical protein